MRWKLIAAMLAIALIAPAAHADEFVDPKGGFRVTIPKGWTQEKKAGDDDLTVKSPMTNKTFGYCFTGMVPLPGTENMTQAQIDQSLTGKFTALFWEAYLKGMKLKNLVVVEFGEEVQNGRNTHYSVATYDTSFKPHKFKTVVHSLPGRQYHLTCNAYLDAYPSEEPAFETFFDSFTPT